MSRKKKILILFHLCFAFIYLCWLLIQPYVKEVLSQKSQLALYEMVLERKTLLEELPSSDQALLLKGYAEVQSHPTPSLLKQVGHLFFVQTPPFALAWLFFSLAICVALLFHIEGAALATYLLPVIVLGYAYFLYAPHQGKPETLFPTEEYVTAHFVELQENAELNRRERLLLGWHRYLIQEWAHESVSHEPALFQAQLDKGLFAFNVARIKWVLEGKGDEIILAGFMAPPSVLRLLCYLIWNCLFAWQLNRKEKTLPGEVVSTATC